MRISDWSSDVCSSDLPHRNLDPVHSWLLCQLRRPLDIPVRTGGCERCVAQRAGPRPPGRRCQLSDARFVPALACRSGQTASLRRLPARLRPQWDRSEEHTSELQSLMRIPYAVFCLKKKKKNALTKT